MENLNKEYASYRKWRVTDPKCVLLLVHGLGASSGRWEAMAGFFLKKGISSYAIDLPKFKRISSYYSEIIRVREIALRDNPGKKIFLIGESLGGLASFLVAAGEASCGTFYPDLFGGLVCISPAFASRKTHNLFEAVKMLAPILYNPAKNVKLPFDSSMCTRDIDCRKKLEEDPREYRSVSGELIFDILMAQSRAKACSKKVNAPVLFLVSGEDLIVDPEVSRKVFDGLSAAEDKTFREFPGMYHALSIELGKEAVFEEISIWTGKRA